MPRRGLRLARVIASGVLAATCLALGACANSETPTAVTILNTGKVERAIETSSLAQRGKRAQVSCPRGVHQQKGLQFSCTAVVKHDSTRFVVQQLDDSGHVRYEAR